MFTTESRVPGYRPSRQRSRMPLKMDVLESRDVPATLIGTHYATDMSGPQANSGFGRAIASNEFYRVVGAPNCDVNGQTGQGLAFVYDAVTGQHLTTLANPNSEKLFGYSVAVSGHHIVIGAPDYDNSISLNVGAAYVYDMTALSKSTPSLVISNPSPTLGEDFGAAVSISGSRLAVSDPNDEWFGSVFIYDLESASPNVPMTMIRQPSVGGAKSFGSSLSLEDDKLAIGAPFLFSGLPGRAYVYDIDSSTPSIPLCEFKNPTLAGNDFFGYSVSIKGRFVVVGEPQDSTGAKASGQAYVFDLQSSVPSEPIVTLNNPTPAQYDRFGSTVAISTNRVLVGAAGDDSTKLNTDTGAAYLYDFNSKTAATPVAVFRDQFPENSEDYGSRVFLFQDQAVISSDGDDQEERDSGAVWIYNVAASSPTIPLTRLANPTPASRDQLGLALAMSGTEIVTSAPYDNSGARDSGSAYVFDATAFTPANSILLKNPQPGIDDQFGQSVAISGKYVAIGTPTDDAGAPDSGSVFVYDLSLPTVQQLVFSLSSPTVLQSGRFGSAVAIAGNRVFVTGNKLVIGSQFYSEVVYVFDLASSNPLLPSLTIPNPTGKSSQFGSSLAISENKLLVGARYESSQATKSGLVWGFDLASSTPTSPFIMIPNPTPATGSEFGAAIAINDHYVVVGAPLSAFPENGSGRTFVFDLLSAVPESPIFELTDPAPQPFGQFGMAVSIDSNHVVVGAPNQSKNNSTTGRAYVYDLNSMSPNVSFLTLENPAPYGQFGQTAAIVGSIVAVGDPLNSTKNYYQGAVHVYSLVPPKLNDVLINSGSNQRSTVSSMRIDFDIPIAFVNDPAAAFSLVNQTTLAPVNVSAQVDASRRSVTLAFIGGSVDGTSLADGRYTLTIHANQFAGDGFDANGDGIAGDNYILVGTPANGLFRLFGDTNGDGHVSAFDFNAFRVAFGSANPVFDFNQDGIIDSLDFQQFRLRYGIIV